MEKVFRAAGAGVPACLAWMAQRVLPPSLWYSAVFQVSRALTPVLNLRRRWAWNGALSQAIFVNRVLALLTRSGEAFPVPWVADGLDLVQRSVGHSAGLILCSAHIPLVKVAARALMESGVHPDAAITDNPSVNGSLAIWGLKERMRALQAGPNVLLRTRSILSEGGTVLLLTDTKPGAPLRPNIFRLAERLGSRVILFSAELPADGVVRVRFFQPPGGLAHSADAQMSALSAEIERIRLRQPCDSWNWPSHPSSQPMTTTR